MIGYKCYHIGISKLVPKSTFADANEKLDWRIYADFEQRLIRLSKSKESYSDDKSSIGSELDSTVYALDSTTIDLCLSLFHWLKLCSKKGTIKMHTLLNWTILQGGIFKLLEIISLFEYMLVNTYR